MKISEIKIGNRFRKDVGDIESLKKSINEIGLLQPIVIDEKNNLIAGYRRLLTFKELGKTDIPINIINIENSLRGEYDENAIRKDFTPSEAVAIWQAMEDRQGTRIELGLRSDSERSENPDTKIIKASKLLKKSTDTLSKAKQVVESGNKKIIEKMDKTGNVHKAYQEVKREKRINEQIKIGKTVKETTALLYNDDFNNVKLENNSIDLIITDPPYSGEYLHCWKELTDYASKVLKPSGFLVAYSGQFYMKEVMNFLADKLEYYWTFCLYHTGATQIVSARNITCRWKPVFVYQKSPFKKIRVMEDYIISGQREKNEHEWQQSESGVKELVERFSKIGDKILDPFMGSGTFPFVATKLKREAIGIEIDKKYYLISKAKNDKTRI